MKTMPFIIGLLLCLPTPALAIPETWVASNGGGAACTRAAPCLTFAAAHTATDPGGTIKCADAANFGVLTITKSITIDCTGTNGGIVATAGNAIVVNAANVVVVLRGLSIDPAPDLCSAAQLIARIGANGLPRVGATAGRGNDATRSNSATPVLWHLDARDDRGPARPERRSRVGDLE